MQFDIRVNQQHTWRQKICYHDYPSPSLYCKVRGEGAASPTVSTTCYRISLAQLFPDGFSMYNCQLILNISCRGTHIANEEEHHSDRMGAYRDVILETGLFEFIINSQNMYVQVSFKRNNFAGIIQLRAFGCH